MAIDGDAVFDATFDAAMARLAAVDAEARLEFFRGDRTELLAAVGRRAAAPGAATITVDDRGERREIVVEAGANLVGDDARCRASRGAEISKSGRVEGRGAGPGGAWEVSGLQDRRGSGTRCLG